MAEKYSWCLSIPECFRSEVYPGMAEGTLKVKLLGRAEW